MADQIATVPGALPPLAYSQEALSIARCAGGCAPHPERLICWAGVPRDAGLSHSWLGSPEHHDPATAPSATAAMPNNTSIGKGPPVPGSLPLMKRGVGLAASREEVDDINSLRTSQTHSPPIEVCTKPHPTIHCPNTERGIGSGLKLLPEDGRLRDGASQWRNRQRETEGSMASCLSK
jgi:hypothetical protein